VWLGGTYIFVFLGPQGVRICKYLLGPKARLIDAYFEQNKIPCIVSIFFMNPMPKNFEEIE
jgi:hypothetical protein